MAYENARVAVDATIFSIQDGKLKVLLRKREKAPDEGKYSLPGGLILPDETAKRTLKRKLKEEFNTNIYCEQFHTFTRPDRDPRGRTISIGFIALIDEDSAKELGEWRAMNELPDLAFDHKRICRKAREYIQENVSPHLLQHMLPELFPLNKLQEYWEVVEGTLYDNRNFRKKMIAAGFVEETEEREKNVSHRPAKLYRFRKLDKHQEASE